ncbi:unnamed protein product [Linum trigynum]|uniref:Uncharacterized protein n=1 Tax=Linum trigynum TaxID=586398 RepID=A0AAV2CJT3_9ROSI
MSKNIRPGINRSSLGKTCFGRFCKGEQGFGSQTPKGRTKERERGRFEGILGVELEDFFALEARGTSPDLKTGHLKILTAVSLFSME